MSQIYTIAPSMSYFNCDKKKTISSNYFHDRNSLFQTLNNDKAQLIQLFLIRLPTESSLFWEISTEIQTVKYFEEKSVFWEVQHLLLW